MLTAELDAWQASKRTANFWWRDDDLEKPGPCLDRLLEMRGETPIALAVIPSTAAKSLTDRLRRCSSVDVIQHGFAHVNHAPTDKKKCELGDDRAPETVLREIIAGRKILSTLFTTQFVPVLAPPWNRISPSIQNQLSKTGLVALSAYGEEDGEPPSVINTHLDPVDWQNGKRFIGVERALGQFTEALRMRRRNAGHARPIGLLTHHRVMDEECWTFVEQFVKVLHTHPGVILNSIRDFCPDEQ
jgi:hypothetical protein